MNDGMIKFGDVRYQNSDQQNRIYHFFAESDLINRDFSFC